MKISLKLNDDQRKLKSEAWMTNCKFLVNEKPKISELCDTWDIRDQIFFFVLKKKIHTDIPAEDLKKDIHKGKNGKTTKYSDGSKNEKGTGFGLYRIETGESFHVFGLFTGHGKFRHHLKMMKKIADCKCKYCEEED